MTTQDQTTGTASGAGKLGLPALIAMVVGSMVGAGVFTLPQRFAVQTGVWGAVIVWVIAGTGMLMLAFVFQTLAVRKPNLDNGVYAYAKEGFGVYPGFLSAIGFWASACAGNTFYWVLITSTLKPLIPAFGDGDTIWAIIVSSIGVWAFCILILRGVQEATFINTIVTIAKLVPLVLFVVLSIFAFKWDVFVGNLSGGYDGKNLWQQISGTMLITVFVFLGIEGASVYSRMARKRTDVGKATVLGFLSVLALFGVITIVSYGILPQEELAKLRQPSVGTVLEAAVGPWGLWFIVVGLIVSVLGAYLAWSLMAAEVLFVAAKDRDLPRFLGRTNAKGAPAGAMVITTILVQILLVLVYFVHGALDFMLDLTAALALAPFALVGMYALKIAITRDGYADATPRQRTRDLVIAVLTVIYTFFLIYAAGLDFVLLACILLAPATILYAIARRENRAKLFTIPGIVVFVLAVVGAITGIVGLAAGWITI